MTLRHLSLASTLMLAGCPFLKTSTSTSVPGSSSSPAAAESSSSDSPSPPGEGELMDTNGNKYPNLIGRTIEDATKRAKAYGFTGRVEVMELSEFDATCKAGTVCRVDSSYWYLNQDHVMTLYKNKAIEIATPE